MAILGALVSACSTGGKKPPSQNSNMSERTQSASQNAPLYGPPEPYGPPAPQDAPLASAASGLLSPQVYGPEPILIHPVVLVFGPGMARAFSCLGVIRELNEAKIPIGAILGTEMGAFLASLYAMDGNINHFEWALLKFKDEIFEINKTFVPKVFQKSQNAEHLENVLREVLGAKSLNEFKIPLQIAFENLDSRGPIIVNKGSAVQAIRAALAVPDFFPAADWNGQKVISAEQTRPFLIAEARLFNTGPVIVVDSLPYSSEASVASELRGADMVIRPDLSGISPIDFSKRTEAAFRGKKATLEEITEIRHLVGLPPVPEEGNKEIGVK